MPYGYSAIHFGVKLDYFMIENQSIRTEVIYYHLAVEYYLLSIARRQTIHPVAAPAGREAPLPIP
jgi:hypothetical protein